PAARTTGTRVGTVSRKTQPRSSCTTRLSWVRRFTRKEASAGRIAAAAGVLASGPRGCQYGGSAFLTPRERAQYHRRIERGAHGRVLSDQALAPVRVRRGQ